jgi:DNA integrity scanning protein DisA with diadenylate cyclase activity
MDDIINKMEDALKPLQRKVSIENVSIAKSPEPPAGLKMEDLPRAGQLSSEVFTQLGQKIIDEMKETVEAQINDAENRRKHNRAQMEELTTEMDKAFESFETDIRKHQQRINMIAEAIQKKVKNDTEEMLALSQRLLKFSDSLGTAHDVFFKGEDEK